MDFLDQLIDPGVEVVLSRLQARSGGCGAGQVGNRSHVFTVGLLNAARVLRATHGGGVGGSAGKCCRGGGCRCRRRGGCVCRRTRGGLAGWGAGRCRGGARGSGVRRRLHGWQRGHGGRYLPGRLHGVEQLRGLREGCNASKLHGSATSIEIQLSQIDHRPPAARL